MLRKKSVPQAMDSLIGEKTRIEGKIQSEASLRIEGQVIGSIESAGDVIIGEKSTVEADITAKDILVAGIVKGNVSTSGNLHIMSTGQLIGDMDTRTFIVEEGGTFQGISAMSVRNEDSKKQQVMAEVKPLKKNERSTAAGH